MLKRKLSVIFLVVIMAISIFPGEIVPVFGDVKENRISNLEEFNQSGDGTQENPYKVNDVDTLYGFLDKAKGDTSKNREPFDFSNSYVELDADIDVSSDFSAWTYETKPDSAYIWSGIPNFNGTFIGNHHFISGLYIENSSGNLGFFNNVNGGSISDFTLKNVFLNVTRHGEKASEYNAGAIVGTYNGAGISNCGVYGKVCVNSTTVVDGMNIAGLVGYIGNKNSCTLSNCLFSGDIFLNNNSSTSVSGCVGGLIGSWGSDWNKKQNVKNCASDGNIKAESFNRVGGLIGEAQNINSSNEGISITNSCNFSNVDGGYYTGGLIGKTECPRSFNGCFNNGNISGSNAVGGICGYQEIDFNDEYVNDCYNRGDISLTEGISTQGGSGGIFGDIRTGSVGQVHLNNGYSFGNLTGNYAGALVGSYGLGGWALQGFEFSNFYYFQGQKAFGRRQGDERWSSFNQIVALEPSQCLDQNQYKGFDFDKTWTMGSQYPILQWNDNIEFKMVHSFPVIKDEQSARAFLCFIFNKSASNMEKISSQDKYLKLITGNYDGKDDDKFLTALSLIQIINNNIGQNSVNAGESKTKSTEALIGFLQDRFGVNAESDNLAQAITDESVDNLKSGLKQTMLGLATLEDEGISSSVTGALSVVTTNRMHHAGCCIVPIVSGNMDWITETMSKVGDAWGKKDILKNYANDLGIAVSSLNVIMNSEYAGRYSYFNQYLSLRKTFGYDCEEAFEYAKEATKFIDTDNNWLAGLIPYLTLGQKSSWISHTDIIDEWAEYTYQLQQAVYNSSTTLVASPEFKNFTHNQIQCPVDVDVLDSSGNIVASIKDNNIVRSVPDELRDQLIVMVAGDTKHIFINEGSIFKLRLTATDSGTMNYSSSYVADGKESIVNNMLGVKLEDGEKFYVPYQEPTQEETSYSKLEKEGGELVPIENEEAPLYKTNVTVEGKEYGMVYGLSEKRKGANVILQAVPNKNCYFLSWKENGNVISKDPMLQFTSLRDRNLTAVFTNKQKQSKPQGLTGDGGIFGTTSSMEYRKQGTGEWQQCEVGTTKVEAGSYEVRYKENEEKRASDSVVVVVRAFVNVLNTTENGKVILSSEPQITGSKVSFTVKPDTGFEIGDISAKDANENVVAVTGENGTYSFEQPSASVTITVTFKNAEETKTTVIDLITPTENGSVNLSPETQKQGETITITTNPSAGYEVDEVKVTDSHGITVPIVYNGNDTYSFTQPNSVVTVSALFKNKTEAFVIDEIKPTENGNVTLVSDHQKPGEAVNITVMPDTGYKLQDVLITDETGNKVPVTKNDDGTYSFTQPETKVTISVSFEKQDDSKPFEDNKVVDEIAATENGSLVLSPELQKTGELVTIIAKPNSGYEVDKISVTDEKGKEVPVTQNTDGTYNFIQPEGTVAVAATFGEEEKPAVNNTIKPTKNGSLVLSPELQKTGELVTIIAKPNSGYEVDKISVTDEKGKE
ncbi:InlB B-repeat-containing protein, partial [Bilifractor sp. LCP21S3_E12]